MKKDWTETLRDRLSESAVTPPEGLWADISSDLDVIMPNAKRPLGMTVWRWVAAAACLAAIVVCGVWIANTTSLHDKTEALALVDVGITPSRQTDQGRPSPQSVDGTASTDGNTPSGQTGRGRPSPQSVDAQHQLADNTPSGQTGRGRPSPQSVDAQHLLPEIPHPDERTEDGPPPSRLTAANPEGDERTEDGPPPSRLTADDPEGDERVRRLSSPMYVDEVKTGSWHNRIAISVYAANPDLPSIDLSSKDLAKDDLMSSAPQDPDFSDPGIPSTTPPDANTPDPGTPSTPPSVKAKHHQPIRYGLSVRIPISPKLSFGTGVTYSRLYSEISICSPSHSSFQIIDQTLHYIGVPMSVDYALPSVGAVSMYLTGGTMAERCVYGEAKSHTTKAERISEQSLQLSVFAGAGIQFNLSDHVSLYAEPLATYYLDNHSALTNVYKDRPLSLDLRLGLRYTLK